MTNCTCLEGFQPDTTSSAFQSRGYIPDVDECLPCPAGTFKPTVGSVECQPCQQGYFALSEAQTVCYGCEPGQRLVMSTNNEEPKCENCTAGTYSIVSTTACTLCWSGSFQPAIMKTTCSNCSAGFFSTEMGATSAAVCRNCLAGTKSASSGQSTCQDCPPGTFSSNASATCSLCPTGTYSTAYGARVGWTVTPGDDTDNDNFIDADEFSPPFSASVWTETQVASLFDRMDNNGDGRLSLTPDSTGFNPAEFKLVGADFLEKREEDLRAIILQIDELNPVLDADYDAKLAQMQLAKLRLEISPSARFNPLTGLAQIPPLLPASSSQVCLGCMPGTYNSVNGSSSCKWCAPGSYSLFGAIDCTLCVPGKYFNVTGLCLAPLHCKIIALVPKPGCLSCRSHVLLRQGWSNQKS